MTRSPPAAGPFRTRDTKVESQAAAALDYGLSQRALIDVSDRTDDVAALITHRLAALAHHGVQVLDEPAVRTVVHQAVHDVRTAPPPPSTDPPADPSFAALRRSADGIAASAHLIGQLMLEVAPEYLSDAAAADVLAPCARRSGKTSSTASRLAAM